MASRVGAWVSGFGFRVSLFAVGAGVLVAYGVFAESDDQGQMDFANGLFQRGFYKEAVEEYRQFLVKSPDGALAAMAWYRLGEGAYAIKDYAAALEAFDKALGLGVDAKTRSRAMAGKGETLYFLKRAADAALILERLTTDDAPGEIRARALYYLGKVHAESNDTDGALKAFKTLSDGMPESPFAIFARYQSALAYVARQEWEKAGVEFSAVAASNADKDLCVEARFRAAEVYDKIGWFAAALGAYEQVLKEAPDSSYAVRAEHGYAWALYHAGKYPEAASAAEAFLKKRADAPEAVGVQYLLGNCLQQQQRYDEALALFNRIRTEHKESEFAGRAQYKVAWCLYLTGKVDESRAEITAYLAGAGDPKLAGDASFLLGSILVAKGEFEPAYEEFRGVAEKNADGEFGAEALYKAAECLAQLGRTEEAAKAFDSFAKQYPDNILAEQALLRAGDAQFASSSFDAAVEKYTKLLDAKNDPNIEQDTLYRLAITYHNMKKFDSSAKTFQKLVAKYPDGPHTAEAHFRIGEFLLRDGKEPVKAIEAYNASLAVDSKGEFAGGALKGVALARYEAKDYDAAMEMFLRLMMEFSAVALNEESYAWVGQRCFDQQKWDQAAVAFRALLQARPDYPNPERVRMKIAECAESAGKAAEAIGLYKEVVDTDPHSATAVEAQYRMAKLYESQNDTAEALKLYEVAANANTGDVAARARFRLGEIYEAQGDCEAAARSYMRVAILFLHEELSPEALWRAGQCFEKNAGRDQAKKSYEELIKDYPTSDQAAKAKEALAKLGP